MLGWEPFKAIMMENNRTPEGYNRLTSVEAKLEVLEPLKALKKKDIDVSEKENESYEREFSKKIRRCSVFRTEGWD